MDQEKHKTSVNTFNSNISKSPDKVRTTNDDGNLELLSQNLSSNGFPDFGFVDHLNFGGKK